MYRWTTSLSRCDVEQRLQLLVLRRDHVLAPDLDDGRLWFDVTSADEILPPTVVHLCVRFGTDAAGINRSELSSGFCDCILPKTCNQAHNSGE